MKRGSVPSEDVPTAITAKATAADAIVGAYAIVVDAGPDAPRSFAIDGSTPSRVLLGQSPACEIRLSDGHVSRRHAAIEPAGASVRMTDLGSTNGTYVNGVRIVEAFVREGDRIELGQTMLRVARAERAPIAISTARRFGRVIGASEEMRRLYPLCEKIAASNVPVVIEGETGTGKEVLADALHEASPRADAPFIVFDCTSVPANLMESALFGHERGAFTGAISTRKGVFEQANGGTLFIDEIGDLDLALQPKLLRAIERSEVQRVGGDKWIRVDVRIIAATRRDLDHEIQAGRFRDDLFFRLAVTRIELPPLRRRRGDIGFLTRHFWKELGGGELPLPYDLLERYEDYAWPGNVRELHNAVARQLALGELAPEAVGFKPTSGQEAAPSGDVIDRVLAKNLPLTRARQLLVQEFESRYLEDALARSGGNVARAAAACGIAKRYFLLMRARHSR
jgi:two-component system, NtrC family, response regulator HydG